MSEKFIYANNTYNSEEELTAGLLKMKDIIENKPTNYMTVKEVTGSPEEGWVIPPEKLTDSQIMNLSGSGFYNVTSLITGETLTGVSASTVLEKLTEYKKYYIEHMRVNEVHKIFVPTTVDMSIYTS